LDNVRVQQAGVVDQFAADVLKRKEDKEREGVGHRATRAPAQPPVARNDRARARSLAMLGVRAQARAGDTHPPRPGPIPSFPYLCDLVAALQELDGPPLLGGDLLGEHDKAKGA